MDVFQMTSNAINSAVLLHYMKKDLMQRFYQYDLRKRCMHFDSKQIHILKVLQNGEPVKCCNVFYWGTEKRTIIPCSAYSKHTEALIKIWEAKRMKTIRDQP